MVRSDNSCLLRREDTVGTEGTKTEIVAVRWDLEDQNDNHVTGIHICLAAEHKKKVVDHMRSEAVADTEVKRCVDHMRSEAVADTEVKRCVDHMRSEAVADTEVKGFVDHMRSEAVADTVVKRFVDHMRSEAVADTEVKRFVDHMRAEIEFVVQFHLSQGSRNFVAD